MRRPVRVLEAGCGRGLNLRAAARLQPGAEFTGIDINRVAIGEASRAVAVEGPENLRFLSADLLDPVTLPPAGEGYDLILSYGVVHHLSDPAAGLRQLRGLLAADGVLALMVDDRYGRQPLDRFLQALAMLFDGMQAGDSRADLARGLAQVAEDSLFKGNCWQGTARVDEVEFADRCLHVHERSYDIDSLWRLLANAGLAFVRWLEPRDWSFEGMNGAPELLQRLARLDPMARFRLIERLFYRPKLTLVAARAGIAPRERLARDEIGRSLFRLNPQLKYLSGDGARYRLRAGVAGKPENPCETALLAQARESFARGFTGDDAAGRLAADGYSRDSVFDALFALEAREWLYRALAESTERPA